MTPRRATSVRVQQELFMGNDNGDAGDPWLKAKFYDPDPTHPQREVTHNPADPPAHVSRAVGGSPVVTAAADKGILMANDYQAMRTLMKSAHDQAHQYIGGTLSDAHASFQDPFVFLLHSNVDRLFAMWQRIHGRLDPATAYDPESDTKGSGTITLSANSPWGILSPLEPWAGEAAQTPTTGIVQNFHGIRPWIAPDNEQLDPANQKDSKHPTVVSPPSYDTAPHSSYFILDRDTFSVYEVQASQSYPAALTLVYDGFRPNELGGKPPAPPMFHITFDNVGGPDASAYISATAQPAQLEDPNGAPDVPQRITFAIDLQFLDQAVFNTFVDTRFIHLRATHGSITTDSGFELIKQPNPYMLDGAISWLSTDVRVFKLQPGGKLTKSNVGQPDPQQDPDAAIHFINNLLTEFRNTTDDANHPFEHITQDEQASALELSQTIGNTPVFNYAVAKVRYRANTVPAGNVQVFFRAFSTLRSALDYSYSGSNPPTINYPRSGTWPNAVPLLGLIDGEIASIPFFASGRIDSTAQSMTAQLLDQPNIQTINAAAGQESVMFFGCWLDFNQPTPRFPQNPVDNHGPFGNAVSIPAVLKGLHVCLVAEILFQSSGTDPIPSGSTPASSDRLAQRNLAINPSGNPGGGATHTVQHTFMLKPSSVPRRGLKVEAVIERFAYDELMIRWNDLPRASKATLYVPEWDADEVLRIAAVRQHPAVLSKLDAHTLAIAIADVGFVPIPGGIRNSYAGLVTIELPQGVRAGRVFRVDFHQYSRMRSRFNGAFRLTIPVQRDEVLLPTEIRHLAVLRYVAEAIPATNRWYPIFVRWLGQLADKVRGLGGDPDKVPPSLQDPGAVAPPGRQDVCVTGKVCSLLYDCFGDFEGFVLADCDEVRHFPAREKAIETVVHRACREQARLTVRFDPRSRRIRGLVVGCA
jgi:hypothetical protein